MFCKSLSPAARRFLFPSIFDGPFNSITCQWYNNKSCSARNCFFVEIRKQQHSQWTWTTKQHFRRRERKGNDGFFLYWLAAKRVRNHLWRFELTDIFFDDHDFTSFPVFSNFSSHQTESSSCHKCHNPGFRNLTCISLKCSSIVKYYHNCDTN